MTAPAKTQTTTRTISRIVIKWERDDNPYIANLDEQMTLDTDNRVDVQSTYEEIMEVGGCTPEQSREQTAANIARVNGWKNNEWFFVGCSVCAKYLSVDTQTGSPEELGEAAYEATFGIESFAGKDYQKEVENDLIAELYHSVKSAGYTITPESWNAVPRTESKESYYEPTDPDPGANVRPLPELPAEDDEFTYRYGSKSDEKGDYGVDDAEGEILATCKSCYSIMLAYDKNDEESHYNPCIRFDETAGLISL